MKKVMPLAIALASGLYSQASSAELYFGVGVGRSDFEVDLTAVGGSKFEDDGTSTKFYGGYGFNDYLALEAALYNYAEASVGAVETSPGSGVFASASADMIGGGLFAVAMYPVTRKFEVAAKLGFIGWDVDLQFNNNQVDDKDRDMAYGLAASYGFTREVHVVAEWETLEADNPEVSTISLGFKFIIR